MRTPCDEAVLHSPEAVARCTREAAPWILTATILGSSMAFIDSTVVNVALPVLQQTFKASVVDVQWVVESYTLFLAALLLPALNRAKQQAQTFDIQSVPTVVVDGKFVTGSDKVGSHAQLPAALDELVAKARGERSKS